MKKFIGLALIVGAFSCASLCNKGTVDSPTNDSGIVDSGVQVVSGDTWSFELASSGWKREELDSSDINVFKNDSTILVFVKEPFDGSLQQYTLLSVRGIRDNDLDAGVYSKSVIINGLSYQELDVLSKSHFWVWLTIQNKFGYTFSCTGNNSDLIVQEKICTDIANTIKIL